MTDNNLCFTIWIQKLLLRRNTDTKTLYYNIKNDNKKIGTLELCEQLGIETIPIRSSDLNKTPYILAFIKLYIKKTFKSTILHNYKKNGNYNRK